MDSLREYKSDSDGLAESSEFLNVSSWWLLIAPFTDTRDEPHTVNILGKHFSDMTLADQEVFEMIHLTYRYGFDPIPRAQDGPSPLSFLPSLLSNKATVINCFKNLSSAADSENFTTDVGWGCMIRTSQTLLANSYLRLSTPSAANTRRIIEMFRDNPAAPYSIHNMVSVASALPLKVKPGEWFGPSAASQSLRRLNEKVSSCDREADIPQLCIIIGENGDVYDDLINDEFSSADPPGGILLLLPVRLGIERFNSYYKSSLSQLLSLPQSAGIAGGKPSSSFYFIGFSGPDMLYLNPHSPQPSLAQVAEETYHTKEYLKLPFDNVDPSMLVGFTFCTQQDYQEFKDHCKESDNKIVHFYPSRAKSQLDLSYDDLIQSSDVSLNHDLQDDFVCISAQEPVEQAISEDFVDLALESNEISSAAEDIKTTETLTKDPDTNHSASYHLVKEPCEL